MLNINKKSKPIVIVSLLIVLSIIISIIVKGDRSKLVSAEYFNKILQKVTIKELYIKDKYIELVSNEGRFKTPLDGINKKEILKKYPVKIYSKSSSYLIYIAVLLLLSILIALLVILRRNSVANKTVALSANRELEDSADIKPQYNSNISFKDIAGISDVKEDLEEIISFLKTPLKYKKLNIRMPKGVLLIGPPGVGKTLIAKAISAEAGVPFFYHSGASFVHIYAGMGAKRVKELFNKAKELAPSIIFIDEIDSVGKDRGNLNSDEREATLNQLLVEMDGFDSSQGVIVIAATNRLDVLDSALLRPGRFDRRIFIDLPNLSEREQIIKLYLKNKKHNLDISYIAKITAGFSPAALETLINEAALNTIKRGSRVIELQDIESVKNRVIYGKKRVPLLSEKEREIQSSYQATKAVIATWLGFEIDRVGLLISININNSNSIISKDYLLNLAKVELSGSIYLEQKYGDVFNLGIEDRALAYSIINEIVTNYSIVNSLSKAEILEEVLESINEMLKTLKVPIESISKKIYDKEVLSYSEIKKEIDALF